MGVQFSAGCAPLARPRLKCTLCCFVMLKMACSFFAGYGLISHIMTVFVPLAWSV